MNIFLVIMVTSARKIRNRKYSEEAHVFLYNPIVFLIFELGFFVGIYGINKISFIPGVVLLNLI